MNKEQRTGDAYEKSKLYLGRKLDYRQKLEMLDEEVVITYTEYDTIAVGSHGGTVKVWPAE